LSSSVFNVPLDIKDFPVDNPNINGTGDLEFLNGILYALDSNNGLVAYVVPEPGALSLLGLATLLLLRRKA